MAASALSTSFTFSNISHHKQSSSTSLFTQSRSSKLKATVCALPSPYGDLSKISLSSKAQNFELPLEEMSLYEIELYSPVVGRRGAPPPIMPTVMTPGGPLDLSTVLFRNCIFFVGQPMNTQVAQRVISQLVTLATIDENTDILVRCSIQYIEKKALETINQFDPS
ncbi:ATP-dependent Clp protease proteolytic subunit 6, chloroplastic-like [Rutidosis leptorrhynchoides]|uniref:ATP-dependent Clp protease proteolytic subunit 6, chloroplastic-like n=1 Tax=Rutidosis leptorrhynchoides TaxID=125765 RepID=UPI003A9936F9